MENVLNSVEQLTVDKQTSELTSTEKQEKILQLENEIKLYLRNSAENVIEVGNRLIEAKKLVEHGQWQKWLENNFQLKKQSAQNFMNIAKRFGKEFKKEDKKQSIGNLNSTQMIALLALPKGQEEEFIKQKTTDGTPVENMSIRNLKTEIKHWNTTHKKPKNKKTNIEKNTIDIDATNATDTQSNNYLLLKQFISLSNDLVNIPNLNELAQKYSENNPDRFAIEIEHLYSIIDTISPKQSK